MSTTHRHLEAADPVTGTAAFVFLGRERHPHHLHGPHHAASRPPRRRTHDP